MSEARVTEQGDLKAYRAEIPNIICLLELSPFELALYIHLKKTAGADGECWKSTETLAKETQMSVGMVSKAKEGLLKPRTLLKGKALISLRTDDTQPGRPRHFISITNIWPENLSHYLQSSPDEVQSSYSELQTSPHELEVHPVKQRKNQEERTSKERVGQHAKKQRVGAKGTRATIPNDPLLLNFAVVVYRDLCHLTPNHEQRKRIADCVTDGVLWFKVCEQFMSEGRPPQRVDWLLERYVKARGQPVTETKEEKQARLKRQYEERAKNGRDTARPTG